MNNWPEDEVGLKRFRPAKDVQGSNDAGKVTLVIDSKTVVLVPKKMSYEKKLAILERYIYHMYPQKWEAEALFEKRKKELIQEEMKLESTESNKKETDEQKL